MEGAVHTCLLGPYTCELSLTVPQFPHRLKKKYGTNRLLWGRMVQGQQRQPKASSRKSSWGLRSHLVLKCIVMIRLGVWKEKEQV